MTELLAVARSSSNNGFIVYTLAAIGGVATARGEHERAARIFGAVDGASKLFGMTLQQTGKEVYEKSAATVRVALDEVAFNAAWAEGKRMTLEQAMEYALKEAEI